MIIKASSSEVLHFCAMTDKIDNHLRINLIFMTIPCPSIYYLLTSNSAKCIIKFMLRCLYAFNIDVTSFHY